MDLLREMEVELANGRPPAEARRRLEVHGQTYHRWRKEHGGLRLDQAKGQK